MLEVGLLKRIALCWVGGGGGGGGCKTGSPCFSTLHSAADHTNKTTKNNSE